jgi:hypothetical protein
MEIEKKFKFDAKQADLIKKSFNDFKNDTLKAIAANNTVGGLISKPTPHSKLTIPGGPVWDRTAAAMF